MIFLSKPKYKLFLYISIIVFIAALTIVGGGFYWQKNRTRVKSETKTGTKQESALQDNEENKADVAQSEPQKEENKSTSGTDLSTNGASDQNITSNNSNTANPTTAPTPTPTPVAQKSQNTYSPPVTPTYTAPSSNDNYTEANAESYLEDVLFTLINAERSRVGAGALSNSSLLEQAAGIRANEESDTTMSSQDHKRPDGRSFDTIYSEIGYGGYTAWGENLVYGYQQNTALTKSFLDTLGNKMFTNWKNSSGHYANMINSNFNQTGLGVNLVFTNGKLYYFGVQNFARR